MKKSFFVIAALLFFSAFFVLMSAVSYYHATSVTTRASNQGQVYLIIEGEASSGTTGGSSGSSGGGGGGGGGGGSGSGGGSSVSSGGSFEIIPEELNIISFAGESGEKQVMITNTGDKALTITVSVTGVEDFVALTTNQIILAAGESKSLSLLYTAPDSGVFAGRVIFTSGELRRDLFLIFNIKSQDALFDVSLTIPEAFKLIRQGELLKASISLLQVGPAFQVDVTANYVIKDFDGNTLYTSTETFSVFNSKALVKEFPTKDLPPGEYILGLEIVYPEGFATSSMHFTVGKKVNLSLVAVIVLSIMAVGVIIFSFLKYKKSETYKRR